MQYFKNLFELIKATFKRWSEKKSSRLAAALAFYTALSLAPLLIFVVALVGFIYSGADAQATLVEQAEGAMGADAAELVTTILSNSTDPGGSLLASLLSLGIVLFSASNLFNQLQQSLDEIWDEPDEGPKGIVRMLLGRLKAIFMVFGIGLMLILVVVIGFVVQIVKTLVETFTTQFIELATENVPGIPADTLLWGLTQALPLVDIGVSFLVLVGLFAWIFRSVPHAKSTWRDVRGGAILTAILFVVGKYLLAIYLGGGSVGSAYGAAGSLLVILVWVYYSGWILFLGASYAAVYRERFGSAVETEIVDDIEAVIEVAG